MQATQDIIKRYYDSFNHQDMESFLALLDPDIVHNINQEETQIGKAAFANFMQHMNHCYKETAKDLVIMVSEDGRQAAAKFIIDGTYIATDSGLPVAKGQRYTLPIGAFFTLKNERITQVINYYNLNDWLRQVGG